jgi:phosphonopyruvate decarboxylase
MDVPFMGKGVATIPSMSGDGRSLRQLLDDSRPALILEAHDALSAALVEEAGFDAIWASSLTLSCALGVRDGELDMERNLDVVEAMTHRVSLPVLVDAGSIDAGRDFPWFIDQLITRGAAGVCIEDKALPKRNSFVAPERQRLVSSEEFCGWLRACLRAIDGRDFVLVARTEALIVGNGDGAGEALRRAREYVSAGAHAMFVHSRRDSFAEIAEFMRGWPRAAPVLCAPTTYPATPFDDFERSGIAGVIWANHMLRSAVAAMTRSAEKLRTTRSASNIEGDIAPVSRLLTIQGEDPQDVSLPAAAAPALTSLTERRSRETSPCVRALISAGVSEVSGVPCSILEPLQQGVEQSTLRYVNASVEGEAIAVAAGAWLGGDGGAVLMQNSGLGNAVNPVISLARPYRIPLIMIVSWRGEPGTNDAVHHYPMGAITLPLLEHLGAKIWLLDDDGQSLGAAARWALRERRLAALVVSRAAFHVAGPRPATSEEPREGLTRHCPVVRFRGGRRPSRATVIERFRAAYDDSLVISSTGFCSRALYGSGSADHHFYMQGSMGFAAGIGLGVTRCTNDAVFVLDGDGALVMRMGTMATIGHNRPHGLVHIVLDNGRYSSTGGQPAAPVSFADVASACAYRRAAICDGVGELDAALAWSTREPGPTLLHLRMTAEESEVSVRRPEMPPEEVAERFRACVQQRRKRHGYASRVSK